MPDIYNPRFVRTEIRQLTRKMVGLYPDYNIFLNHPALELIHEDDGEDDAVEVGALCQNCESQMSLLLYRGLIHLSIPPPHRLLQISKYIQELHADKNPDTITTPNSMSLFQNHSYVKETMKAKENDIVFNQILAHYEKHPFFNLDMEMAFHSSNLPTIRKKKMTSEECMPIFRHTFTTVTCPICDDDTAFLPTAAFFDILTEYEILFGLEEEKALELTPSLYWEKGASQGAMPIHSISINKGLEPALYQSFLQVSFIFTYFICVYAFYTAYNPLYMGGTRQSFIPSTQPSTNL